jgi:hypothetical protein
MSSQKLSFTHTARAATLALFCFAFSGCGDTPTKPAAAARSLEPSGMDGGLTLSKSVSSQATAAVTGGEAEARVEHDFSDGDFSSVETYAFQAESESEHQFPLAKGKLHWRIVSMFGTTKSVAEIEAKVNCLTILPQASDGTEPAGTNAWVSGPVTRYTINGQVVTPQQSDILARVLDLGKAHKDGDDGENHHGGNDLAGRLSFSDAMGCRSLRPLTLSPEAKVEVHPRKEREDKH